MLDPLLTLLAAKAKAVGLVAGTALVTTALVGGGAVAMTAVSNDAPLTTTTVEAAASPAADALLSQTASATPTVGIAPSPLPGQVDTDGDQLDDLSGLPLGFACDAGKNHGQNVSGYARSLPKGPGRGPLVSAVAKSDCGKTAATEATASASPEPAKSKAPKPAKAAKPAKPAKAEKPAKAKPAKAAKPQKPAKQGGKPEGKGKGKG